MGTSTEIYEYLKLLYARIGKTYSPVSGNLVKRDTVTTVVDQIIALLQNTRVNILPYFCCQLLAYHCLFLRLA